MMNDFISSKNFHALKTLSKQLRICCSNETVHLECVLQVNNIEKDCAEIVKLLANCYDQVKDAPPQALSSALTELTESCEIAISSCLNSAKNMNTLRQWAIILKSLNDSFELHQVSF
jgi:hypothetical protein